MEEITEREVKLVQATWQKAVPISFDLSQTFYSNLFEKHPEFKPLFKNSMSDQGKKLMQMLGTSVLSLNNLSKVTPILKESGLKHQHEYGVKNEYYAPLKIVLLDTFESVLGDEFSEEVRGAWSKVYDILSEIMIEGTRKEESIFMKILKKSKFW